MAHLESKGITNKSEFVRRAIKKEIYFDDLYACVCTIKATMEAMRNSSNFVEPESETIKPSLTEIQQ